MKLRKRFDSIIGYSDFGDKKKKFATFELIERENNEVDLMVRNFVKHVDDQENVVKSNRSVESPEPVYRLRFKNNEPLRKISNVISRFLSSKTKPAFTETFSDIEYELLESAYKPGEELDDPNIGDLSFTLDKHRERYVMWFSIFGGGKEFEFNVATSEEDDSSHDNLTEFLGFTQDFTQKGIFWNDDIKWEDLPRDLQNAKTRIESAEKKFFNNNRKGAAAELREAFHAMESMQDQLEQIDEKKIKDIMRSADNIKDFALHVEQRDESLNSEDVELVMSNFNNTLNCFAMKFEKNN